MGSGYRINVALNGRHLFDTDPESAWTKEKAKELYETIKKKFPESEGYTVMVTYWRSIGKHVEF